MSSMRDDLLSALLRWQRGMERQDSKLNLLIQEVRKMAGELDRLKQEVQENSDVISSAIVLLGSLSQLLKDAIAANDPAALQKLADDLDAQQQSLAAAVAANTPAAPAPGPTP